MATVPDKSMAMADQASRFIDAAIRNAEYEFRRSLFRAGFMEHWCQTNYGRKQE